MKKRFFALVTAAVILLSMILTASAAEYKNFSLSYDMNTISDGETDYERISIPDGYFIDSHYIYSFYYPVGISDHNTAPLCALSADHDLLRIEFYDDKTGKIDFLYAAPSARDDIAEFVSGKSEFYKIRSNYSNSSYGKIDASLVSAMVAYAEENPNATLTVDVSKLLNADFATSSYTLLSYSKNYVIAREYGGIYEIDGEWFYVNFGSLGNNNFDANGYFSYRKGEVTLTKLSKELGAKISAASVLTEYWSHDYETEYQYVDEDFFDIGSYEDSLAARVFFWVIFSLFGFVMPAIPMIFGLVLPNTKKRRTKKWYIVAACSLLWIIAALVIMLILLL
ncbi:MAG: hypothetical protein J5894_00840 [Clostridia bacterium]|nr:hypothetical protein [Clostridia bacterium]